MRTNFQQLYAIRSNQWSAQRTLRGSTRHEQRQSVGSAESEERETQAHGDAGEDAQTEADGESVDANARHRESDAEGVMR